MAKEVKSVVFRNFSDEEFVCSWDKTPYRFAPGKEMYVEDWKAEHFAKHLIDREMHKKGQITSNNHEREKYLILALPEEKSISVEEMLDKNATQDALNSTDKVAKKGRPKKVVEFIGLNKK